MTNVIVRYPARGQAPEIFALRLKNISAIPRLAGGRRALRFRSTHYAISSTPALNTTRR